MTIDEIMPSYKVGDLVEVTGHGRTIHGKCISTEGTVIEPNNMIRVCGYLFNPDGTDARYRLKTHGYAITRKLKPSEVVVEIGCLSGTVMPIGNQTFMLMHNEATFSTIRFDALDGKTRSLVESLLKAQEEECQWLR